GRLRPPLRGRGRGGEPAGARLPPGRGAGGDRLRLWSAARGPRLGAGPARGPVALPARLPGDPASHPRPVGRDRVTTAPDRSPQEEVRVDRRGSARLRRALPRGAAGPGYAGGAGAGARGPAIRPRGPVPGRRPRALAPAPGRGPGAGEEGPGRDEAPGH